MHSITQIKIEKTERKKKNKHNFHIDKSKHSWELKCIIQRNINIHYWYSSYSMPQNP